MKKTTLKVETVALDQIKPYWRNPRNNAGAVEAVKQSIEEYGFNSPLVLDKQNVIIAGHTRYKALLELGWKEAPCVVLDLPAAKAKEYRIADNKTSELSTWDMGALIPELREIEAIGQMQVFFPDLNLDSLLQETATVQMPTAAEIEKKQEKMESQFAANVGEVTGNYIEMLCPHCGEAFFVDKAEMARQPGQDKE